MVIVSVGILREKGIKGRAANVIKRKLNPHFNVLGKEKKNVLK